MIDSPLRPAPIEALVEQLDDLLAEIKERIAKGIPDKEADIGKNDTPLVPGAPDTTIQKLRKSRGHDTAASVARAVMADHLANRRGTANSFIRACRRLGSSFSQGAALKIAMQAFPREYKAYVDAQNRGESLPPLFRKPGYQKRLQRAIKNGGRLV